MVISTDSYYNARIHKYKKSMKSLCNYSTFLTGTSYSISACAHVEITGLNETTEYRPTFLQNHITALVFLRLSFLIECA